MNHLVSVIGTVFMDVKGFATQTYNTKGRNLGNVKFVHGGVGRNVAETLAGIDIPTRLVSTVDDNGLGIEITNRLRSLHVDTQFIPSCPKGMGMWLAVLDEGGDLSGSISQVPDFTKLQHLIEVQGQHIISSSSHIALEIDLTEPIARKVIELAKFHQKPVYGLPGNLDIVMKHPGLLEEMQCFICNHVEAGKLTGINFESLTHSQMIATMTDYVHSHKIRSVVVTLGADGSIYYDRSTGVSGHQPVFPVQMVDSTGAGDSFFAGTIMGLVRGLPLDQAVIAGSKVAGWVIESSENNCPYASERMASDPFFQNLLVN